MLLLSVEWLEKYIGDELSLSETNGEETPNTFPQVKIFLTSTATIPVLYIL